MLALFANQYVARGKISIHPKAAWWKDRVQENVKRQQDYAASIAKGVFANHPLVQALKHAGSYEMNAVALADLADARYPYISKSLKFTTEYNTGDFEGHKVYNSINNMIYSSSEYVRPYSAVEAWKSLRPFTCLWRDTPYVDMSIPNIDALNETLFSSVYIDIPLMALMYKGFKEERRTVLARNQDAGLLTEEHFVAMYVLPSILESQVDITAVSALIAVYEGNYDNGQRVQSHMYLPSYAEDYRFICTKIIERISDTRTQYSHMLQHIPGVYKENGFASLQLPDFAETSQVNWAFMVTRFKVIRFLIDVGGAHGRRANQGFIQQLKNYVRRIDSMGIPSRSMSDVLQSQVTNFVKYVHSL